MSENNESSLKKINDSGRKNTFTLAIGGAVMVIVMIMVAIKPAISSVIKQISSNKTRSELITLQETKLSNLMKLNEDRNRYTTEIELFKEAFPEHDDVEFVERNIYEYLNENKGINISSYTVDYKSENEVTMNGQPVSRATISITLDSDIENILKLVKYLESFPRIIQIEQMNFGINEDVENPTQRISGSMSLVIYFQKNVQKQI